MKEEAAVVRIEDIQFDENDEQDDTVNMQTPNH